MQNELIKYMSKYLDITKELEDALIESSFIKQFSKETILLKEGQISNECFFIFNGCIRSFYFEEGEEITTALYTEEQSVTPTCYGKNMPSKLYYECLEDTTVTVGTPNMEKEMYAKHPQLETLSRAIYDQKIADFQEELFDFKHSSPEQRYLKLLETRPNLFQRVPLHQIASYLGMKPESLSRIRKRLHLKSKKTDTYLS
jgi:CRP-like cAMP-binding protein